MDRDRERSIALADAQAKAELIEQEARTNARAVLLTAIMEGLQQVQEHHPKKDEKAKVAIAEVYLDALKNMIDQQIDQTSKPDARTELQKEKDKRFPK